MLLTLMSTLAYRGPQRSAFKCKRKRKMEVSVGMIPATPEFITVYLLCGWNPGDRGQGNAETNCESPRRKV